MAVPLGALGEAVSRSAALAKLEKGARLLAEAARELREQEDVVHRDLKPENVQITDEDRAKARKALRRLGVG